MYLFFVLIYMASESIKKSFHDFQTPEPPKDLFGKIMSRIRKEQRTSIRRRIIIFSIGLLGSLAAFIPVFQSARNAFAEFGFIQFFSLLFSDSEIIITYWRSFVLTLLESLPVMSIVALLAIILIFLESLKLLVKNITIFLNPAPIKITNN